MNKIKSFFRSHAFFAIVAIIIGLLVGAVFLAIVKISPITAYNKMITGVFGKPKFLAYAVVYATPLIFTGLSVAFSFKTGVFNIGAEGQFIVGSAAALACGILFDLPPVLHVLLCMVAAALAGAIWGMIVGSLKVRFGINEVLSMIMFNWIAFYLSNLVVTLDAIKTDGSAPASKNIRQSAMILFSESARKKLCPVSNYGIIFAIIAVIAIYLIIDKTTLGYRLKAVGYNKDAALFGGINVGRSILSALAISGILSGLAGATHLMGMGQRISELSAQEGFGFQGISVALIGGSNPIGVLFSGIFYGMLKYGGSKLNVINAPSEIVDIIMGSIVFFIAIAHAFRELKIFKERSK